MRITNREYKLSGIKKFTPRLSWLYCECCWDIIHGEPMWKKPFQNMLGGGYHTYCTRCCPTKEHVLNMR